MTAQKGRTEPRIWTRPLRELTPKTSRGFEVIDFASQVLHVDLYPWQRWALVHGLEILEDESYRFRRVIVLVARQNGKSLLATVLAAWWLFVESRRFPRRVPPVDFKVLGTAQNIDIARGPWERVKLWCDPEPEDDAEFSVIPMLQQATTKVLDSNGKEQILAANGAHYQVRASVSARGKPAARVIMDELREHKNFKVWNAVAHTQKNLWSSQTWGISNAGDVHAVVLKSQRTRCIELIEEFEEFTAAGGSGTEYAANPAHDVSLGLFEWSAPDECDLEDVDGILQANPSIGYGAITVAACLSEARASDLNEAGYRTEVLCQWVAARVEPFISPTDYREVQLPSATIAELIDPGSRTVFGVDTSADRSTSHIAVATRLSDGRPFVQVVASRPGMLWVVDFLREQAERLGLVEIALQTKGCPAMEFASPVESAGFTLHKVDGGLIGSATGRLKDRIRDRAIAMVDQPALRLGFEGGLTAMYAENQAWSRRKSLTDVSPVIAVTLALYGLEACEPEPVEIPGPPPAAEVITADVADHQLVDLATVKF